MCNIYRKLYIHIHVYIRYIHTRINFRHTFLILHSPTLQSTFSIGGISGRSPAGSPESTKFWAGSVPNKDLQTSEAAPWDSGRFDHHRVEVALVQCTHVVFGLKSWACQFLYFFLATHRRIRGIGRIFHAHLGMVEKGWLSSLGLKARYNYSASMQLGFLTAQSVRVLHRYRRDMG